jgi:hypothetical protein
MHTQDSNILINQIDLDGLNEDITKRIIKQKHEDDPDKADILYRPNIRRLGFVTSNNGMIGAVDEEAVTTLCPGGKLELEIYQKSRSKLVMSFGPAFILTLEVADLLKHHPGKEGVSLKEHMGERYQYNSRIIDNQKMLKRFLIEE